MALSKEQVSELASRGFIALDEDGLAEKGVEALPVIGYEMIKMVRSLDSAFISIPYGKHCNEDGASACVVVATEAIIAQLIHSYSQTIANTYSISDTPLEFFRNIGPLIEEYPLQVIATEVPEVVRDAYLEVMRERGEHVDLSPFMPQADPDGASETT